MDNSLNKCIQRNVTVCGQNAITLSSIFSPLCLASSQHLIFNLILLAVNSSLDYDSYSTSFGTSQSISSIVHHAFHTCGSPFHKDF